MADSNFSPPTRSAKRLATNNMQSVPAKRLTRSTSLCAERTEENANPINGLISKNCHLIDEIIAVKNNLVERDEKIIKAYKTLYNNQLAGEQKDQIIACQKKQIADLKSELKCTKIEAFGKDLVDFGMLNILCNI